MTQLFDLHLRLGNNPRDFRRQSRGTVSQRFHFRRDNAEPPASIASPRGFNGRIQSQKIGLRGNARDILSRLIDLMQNTRHHLRNRIAARRHIDAIGDDPP